MKPRHLFTIALFLSLTALPARADVVVVDNRTEAHVSFETGLAGGRAVRRSLAAGEVLPLWGNAPINIAFTAGTQARRYVLQPYSINSFRSEDKNLDLFQLPLRPSGQNVNRGEPSAADQQASDVTSLCKIPVMILADDAEPTVQRVWEKRLRKRLADASEIFAACCHTRFDVVAVSTWVSDRNVHDFARSLGEFERKVRPGAARLAIGFTGQYTWQAGERHLGGTHGPLGSHILIRGAFPNASEPEELEVLVHELGHFLGAAHTLDANSVMRPGLGDKRARRRSFRIGFDAPNTMVMCLVSEQLRRVPRATLAQFPLKTRLLLGDVYALLAKAMPQDPVAAGHAALLALPPGH